VLFGRTAPTSRIRKDGPGKMPRRRLGRGFSVSVGVDAGGD
jgi:hypothetical protein